MGWSIWQSLKAREQAKSPPRPSVKPPSPPSMKILLEIFAPPQAVPREEAATPEPARKEA
jgi:hypothetical protein